jgi:hypothetical protein
MVRRLVVPDSRRWTANACRLCLARHSRHYLPRRTMSRSVTGLYDFSRKLQVARIRGRPSTRHSFPGRHPCKPAGAPRVRRPGRISSDPSVPSPLATEQIQQRSEFWIVTENSAHPLICASTFSPTRIAAPLLLRQPWQDQSNRCRCMSLRSEPDGGPDYVATHRRFAP